MVRVTSDGAVEMGHDGLTSREPIVRLLNAALLVWEVRKEKAVARLDKWKTRLLGFTAHVSIMVLFVVSLPVLFLIACMAAQLPPGEEWE